MSSKKYEEEIYIVKVRRERDREFGDHVTEVWLKPNEKISLSPGMNEQFRPYDRPSATKFNPKTGETLMQQWTLEGVAGFARKNPSKPNYVDNGSFKPHRLYGRAENGDQRAEFPSYVKEDEKTGSLTKIVYDEDSEWMYFSGDSKPEEPEI